MTIIILTTLLIVFIIIIFLYNNLFRRIDNLILNKNDIHQYLKTVHKCMYKNKLSNYVFTEKNNFYEEYIRCIKPIPKKYLCKLNKHINYANKLIKQNKFKLFDKYKWNCFMSINQLESDMPFTISDFIIIPKNILDKLTDKINIKFVCTLIHEKVHIIQRFNEKYFDKIYERLFPFAYKYDKEMDEQLKKIYMTNPDSNNTIWLYKIDNKYYVPLYVAYKNKYEQIGFNEQNITDIIDLKKIKELDKFGKSLYHPNEIFANNITKDIINNKNSIYTKYINNL